jgi:AraC-like DNA-binding protein
MQTINPADSDWLLIHINLSRYSQKKKVGSEIIQFQKNLPIGILFCGPDLEMNTVIPIGVETEVLSIRFDRPFINAYLPELKNTVDLHRHIAYEDIDDELGEALLLVLMNMENKLACHAYLLSFLHYFFKKLSKHEKSASTEKIHPEDLKNILEISTIIRDPLQQTSPTLEELAQKAQMGKTKFKQLFKMVFGLAPLQYRNRIRMEYAKEELMLKRKTASEISFDLGYAHPSNFTAAFKRYFGVLPSSL